MKELTWKTCLRAGVTMVAVYLICAGRETLLALLWAVTGALSPLLIGGGVACVAELPMDALERRLFPRGGTFGRGVCLTVSLAGMTATALWLAAVILPELATGLTLLAGSLPPLLNRLMAWLCSTGASKWLSELPQGQELLAMLLEQAGGLLKRAADGVSALTAGAANAALSLVFAAYLLAGKERISAQMKALICRLPGERTAAHVLAALAALRQSFRVYIAGQCTEALLLGSLCLLGMMLLGLPHALTISAIAGVSALIPLLGSPVAAAAGAVLLVPEGTAAAVTFVVFFLVLQQVESSLIYPRMAGEALGLPPVWMLTAMLAGGGAFGLTGAMLAVPVAAAAARLIRINDQ